MENIKLPRLLGGTNEERVKAEMARARLIRKSNGRAREITTIRDVKAWIFYYHQNIFEKDCN